MNNVATKIGNAVIAIALGLFLATIFVGGWELVASLHEIAFNKLGAKPLPFVVGMGLSAAPFLYFYYLKDAP